MTPFLHKVALELDRARRKHSGIHSPHEGYAVLLEEVEEFWYLVKQQRPDPAEILKELIHVAAMAARTAEDCGLIDHYDTPEVVIGWLKDVQETNDHRH